MAKSAVNWYTARTAEQWAQLAAELRQQATDSHRRSAESFDRCDTDGFLSQWASDSMGRHYRACAELADNHGLAEHHALFTVDGELVSTQIIDGTYGMAWRTTDEHVAAGGRRFVNPSKAANPQKRYDNLRKRGYMIGTVRIRSGVFPRSGGAWQVLDMVEPLRDATEVEIVATDNGPDVRD